MTDFKNINYLKEGNNRQRQAYQDLNTLGVFNILKDYNPVLTGTIPIDIDHPGSDLDIICECKNHHEFTDILLKHFGDKKDFSISTRRRQGMICTRVKFWGNEFLIEVLAQDMPVEEQNAYRHMLVEHKILEEKGEQFKSQIRELKKKGIKTEPAFAKVLGIIGDPYAELLNLSEYS